MDQLIKYYVTKNAETAMSEPTITCPNCRAEIHLTESLAAPLVEATRRQFEEQISLKDAEVAARELGIKSRETALAESKRQMDERVAARVAEQVQIERARVADEEAAKAKRASASELESKAEELAELKDLLTEREKKLAEAQKVQADLIRKQRELDDAKREFELTIEKRVHDSLQEVRDKAKNEVEQSLNLRVLEKDQTIASMQKTIAELKQKSEQGSQQLQGEVLELELENLLRSRFPFDSIEPVAKGEFGGDVLQVVFSPSGQRVGSILWESKRTKNWSDSWLVKLREDQRTAKAEIAILVSQVLPKAANTFDMVDGVWVTTPKTLLPVATVLRDTLLQIGMIRQASEGQQTKTEMVYQYLTGPRFRQRVEAIVEAFSSMQSDLDRERRAIMKQWSKREEQIERVMGATVGMWGDFQGIVGKSLHEIKGLEFDALDEDSNETKALPES
jgi:hypothetical protein